MMQVYLGTYSNVILENFHLIMLQVYIASAYLIISIYSGVAEESPCEGYPQCPPIPYFWGWDELPLAVEGRQYP